jgi:cytochrome c oxidase subunit 4
MLIINLVQIGLAVVALGVAGWTVAVSQLRAGIDDLFIILVCLCVALMALIGPFMWARSTGMIDRLFKVEDAPEGAVAADGHDHAFEGSNKLFINVWIALLALTALEVYLAYVHLDLMLMLTIVMGASIIKAALIMAYFMHLRFERMTLVLTLVPAMVICMLLLFISFPDSFRIQKHRSPPAAHAAAEAPAER